MNENRTPEQQAAAVMGRKGGAAGTGKAKRRGTRAWYAAIGRLGGAAGTGAAKARHKK